METYRIEILGESCLFVLQKLSDKNIKISDGKECDPYILIEWTEDTDYTLRVKECFKITDGAVLRAFSVYLCEVRGYPSGIYDISINGRKYEFHLSKGNYGGVIGNFAEIRPKSMPIQEKMKFIKTPLGVCAFVFCEDLYNYDIEKIGKQILNYDFDFGFIKSFSVITEKNGACYLKNVDQSGIEIPDIYVYGAVSFCKSQIDPTAKQVKVISDHGVAVSSYMNGEARVYTSDFKVCRIY